MKHGMQKLIMMLVFILSALSILGCGGITAEKYYNHGLKYYREGIYDKADTCASAALAIQYNKKYRALQAWISYKKRELGKAEQIFTLLYNESKNDIDALQGFAWVAFLQGRYSESEQWFEKELHWARKHVNNLKWEEYLFTDQKYILSIVSDSYYGLGLNAMQREGYAEAETLFVKALKNKNDFTGHDSIQIALQDALYLQDLKQQGVLAEQNNEAVINKKRSFSYLQTRRVSFLENY